MKKKIIGIVMLVLILALLTGCGKPKTPEEIWNAYQEAAKGLQCTKMEMTMDMGISMELPAAGSSHTVNLDMKLKGTTVATQEPFASQSDMTIDVHYSAPEVYMDQSTRTDSVTYTLMEEGQLVSYTQTMGMWVRTETGMNPEDLIQNADAIMDAAGLTFQKDETVTDWEGKPAVCLTTTITGENFRSMLDTVLGGMEQSLALEAEKLDFPALTYHIRLYIDTETWLPLAEEMTVEGMDKMLGTALGETGQGIDIGICTATVRYLSFDPQPPIELPEGARDKALRWERFLAGNPDNGDGTYTIGEGSGIVDITVPEGFEVEEAAYDRVIMSRPDHTRSIQFTMYYFTEDPNMEGQAFRDSRDLWENRYKEYGAKVDRQTGTISTEHWDYTTDLLFSVWNGGYRDGELYAWTPVARDGVNTYYLEASVHDGYNSALVGEETVNATITEAEFGQYLSYAAPSDLMG